MNINNNAQESIQIYQELCQNLQNQKGNIYLLQEIQQYVNNHIIPQIIFLNSSSQNRSNQIQLQFQIEKLKIITQLLPHIHSKPNTSIFNRRLKYETYQLDDPNSLNQQLDKFYKQVYLGHAYVHAGHPYTSKFIQELVRNSKAILYLTSEEEANLVATQALTNPTIEHALTLWRIIDTSKFVRTIYKQKLDNVNFKQIIYLPRLFEPITIENVVNKQLNLINMSSEQIINLAFRNIQKKINETDIRIRVMCSKNNIFNKKVSNKEMNKLIIDLCNGQESLIKSQILEQKRRNPFSFMSCCMSIRDDDINQHLINNIIIHIHGGGFVSMSSFSHQSYTRKWVNQLNNTLIFSIDYRLAPENPFPDALDDCWQSYLWIIYFGRLYFQINPINIILTGDSAGGNLVMGVVMKAIELNQRIPDKIILQYPALNLNIHDYVPSNLKSLDDKMIPFSLLLLCLQSYLKSGIQPTNQYCSPHYMDEKYLLQMPKDFLIYVGNEDVLRDNSIEFVNRFLELGLTYPKIMIFEGLPHGWQNLASNGIRAAEKANQIIIEQMKEYIL